MITIIKNGDVFIPEYIGKKDIIINDSTIEGIYERVNIPMDFAYINIIDASGKLVVPGFIDSHVHILGGGGEGGFKTRTPEIHISDLLSGGITTVVGCLGTDGICRDLKSLLAKARALEEEGVSTYIYTGSYKIPVNTITESCESDIMLIDKVIGVGEIAVSDNRSSQPTFEEFLKVVASARVGGMLSGKAGIVNIHIGDGERRLEYLVKTALETEIPIKQMLPTHINRSVAVFEAGAAFVRLGGIIDLTTSFNSRFIQKDMIRASKGLRNLLDRKIPIEHIQFSSDGQASLPIFNKSHELIGMGIGSVKSLYGEVRNAVLEDGVELSAALKVITSNVADHLMLPQKGRIAPNKDADIVVLTKKELLINDIISKGKEVMRNSILLVKEPFS